MSKQARRRFYLCVEFLRLDVRSGPASTTLIKSAPLISGAEKIRVRHWCEHRRRSCWYSIQERSRSVLWPQRQQL